MIHFENLKFIPCLNHPDGNSKAELVIGEYQLDIIKKPVTRTYKIKPFERIQDKKRYLADVFPEYSGFPEFAGRELLMVFLNEIDRPPIEEESSEEVEQELLDEEIDEESDYQQEREDLADE